MVTGHILTKKGKKQCCSLFGLRCHRSPQNQKRTQMTAHASAAMVAFYKKKKIKKLTSLVHIKSFFKKNLLVAPSRQPSKQSLFLLKQWLPIFIAPRAVKKVAKCGSTMLVAFFTLFQIHINSNCSYTGDEEGKENNLLFTRKPRQVLNSILSVLFFVSRHKSLSIWSNLSIS